MPIEPTTQPTRQTQETPAMLDLATRDAIAVLTAPDAIEGVVASMEECLGFAAERHYSIGSRVFAEAFEGVGCDYPELAAAAARCAESSAVLDALEMGVDFDLEDPADDDGPLALREDALRPALLALLAA